MGFEAEIGMAAKAKVEAKVKIKVGKFLTVIRGANNNIEGFNINNLPASLIALIGLIILPGLIILTDLIFIEKIVIKVIKILLGRKIVVATIRFSYFL